MRWTSLGHAGWLIEAAGLRLLCDPLLEVEHFNGVFEVGPRRRLRAAALRPDFILVSHRHPDHFDVPSLAQLAALDPESVVVTPDELVAWAARELGFSTVHLLGEGQRVELDGLAFATTDSLGETEWGVMVASEDGVVWNMIDSVLRSAEHARALRDRSLSALGHERLQLALVQGQPMLEVQAQLGQGLSFPYERYAQTLQLLAALDAEVVVAASASSLHTGPHRWLDRMLHPVDESRFVRDFARLCPDTRVFGSELGASYLLRDKQVLRAPPGEASRALIEPLDDDPPRVHRPDSVPPLRDPASEEPSAQTKAELDAWVGGALRDALVEAYPSFGVSTPLRLAVELIYPNSRAAWPLIVDREGAALEPGLDPSWDALNLVAGSMLAELLAGQRHWGELLLGGTVRGYLRAYDFDASGQLRRANLAQLFLYYALSYAESCERVTRWQVAEALSART